MLRKINPRCLKLTATRSLATIATNSEYSEVAEYPPILDDSYKAKKGRSILQWHEKIKKIGTIEEKLIEINIPRYYGYKCCMLGTNLFPYNSLPFIKYTTNTELEVKDFHSSGEEEAKKVDAFLGLIRSEVADAVEFELEGYKKFFDLKSTELTSNEIGRARSSGLVKQLNRVLINSLGPDHRHLYELDSDVDPRHEAFWFVGGINPPDRVKKGREKIKWMKPYANDPVDRPFQYIGKPFLALRHLHPLKPFEDFDFTAVTSANENIPTVPYDPTTMGFVSSHRHGSTIPGFWPGNVREYGMLSFHEKNAAFHRKSPHKSDAQDAIHSQGILTSYGWLLGQACYQGFSTYNDMDYPLATQTVVTDGQNWSFYKYQMNTTCIHTSIEKPNYRYNKCWGTEEMRLYESIDEKGRLQGLNDDVLRTLIKFYINQPEKREHEMKPFLDAHQKKIADLEDTKQRGWLEKKFKHIMANRPRHRPIPEIYSWEKIYKIDNDTRPLHRKLRFFELGINPFRRRLNEHQPEYIPRAKRARGIHDKKRWDATYYPGDHRANIPKERPHSMLGAPRDPFWCKMDRLRKSNK